MTQASTIPLALGFRAVRGGSVVVCVALDEDEPRVVLSSHLATASEGDRLAFEPYQVAFEMARGPGGEITPDIAAAVAEGRRRQAALAEKGLADLLARLREMGGEPATAALLINRAGWMTDLLAHSLSAPEHPPVAEGLAVRVALRLAFRECELPVVEMDEKSLPDIAAALLGLTTDGLEARLKALGGAAGRPWRKQQKLACLAAWMALAAPPNAP